MKIFIQEYENTDCCFQDTVFKIKFSKFISFLVLMFTAMTVKAFAQPARVVPLSLENATWIFAMHGRATSEPCATSYGVATVSSNRFIFSFDDESGLPVVQRTDGKRNSAFLSVLENDFFATVSDFRFLNFINPSGITLWTRDVEFTVTEKPFQGRDGRIFVRGAENIACYGLNGTRKWTVSTAALSNFPICELDDGGLMLFLAQKEDGKTVALRISPFGEILAEILFNKDPVSVSTSEDGVVVAFSDGEVCLVAVENGKISLCWTVYAAADLNAGLYVLPQKRVAFVCRSNGGSSAYIISTEDGTLINTLNFSGINSGELTVVQDSLSNGKETLVLADSHTAVSVGLDNVPIWTAVLPSRGKGLISWEQVAYTKNNFLIFFTTNWAVIAFKTVQDINPRTVQNINGSFRGGYEKFYNSQPQFEIKQFLDYVDPYLADGQIAEMLTRGDYGKDEKSLNSYVMSSCNAYREQLVTASAFPSPNIFTRDVSGTDSMLELLPLFETSDASKMLSDILSREQDVTHIRTILKCISAFPYDADGGMLEAIKRVSLGANSRDDITQTAVCYALYNLCRFMGGKPLSSGAHDLLVGMLSPQYSSSVRNSARNALSSLAEVFQ